MKKILENKKIIYIGLFIFSLILFMPYINFDTLFTHDISYHLNRIVAIKDGLKDGNFPVIIASNLQNGYGYCNALFYPELFLYIPAILALLGIGYLAVYKFFIYLTILGTIFISYYSANLIFKDRKYGIMFALVYGSAFYRITDTFIRGALGEVLAMVFLPLVIAGLYEIIFGDNKKWWIISIGLFGVVNSHMLTLLMIAIVIIIFVFINIVRIFKDKKRFINLVKAGILSLLLSCSFILPYLEQARVNTYNVNIHTESIEFFQEGTVEANKIFKILGLDSECYKSIGIILPLFSLLILFQIKNNENYSKYMKEVTILGFIVYLLSFWFIKWGNIAAKFPIIFTVQFPYRLNIISTILLSFSAAYSIVELIKDKEKILFSSYIIFILYSMIFVNTIDTKSMVMNIDELMAFSPMGNSEYLPYGFNENCKEVKNVIDDKVFEYIKSGNKLEFDYDDLDSDMQIHIPLVYYKGYKAYITDENGKKDLLTVSESQEDQCIIISNDTVKTGHIEIMYKLTKVQICSFMLTSISLIGLIIYIIINKKNRKEN